MLIHTINPLSAAIYIEKSDLASLGKRPDELTASEAAGIVRRLTVISGCAADMQLDMFPGADDVLCFVRFGRLKRLGFSFSSLEDLLSALGPLEPIPSSLFFLDGRYILFISFFDSVSIPGSLYEYGMCFDASSDLILHISEQGQLIIEKRAVELLRRFFS